MRQEQKERMEEARKAALVREIAADFEARREARRSLERGWQLNMNFVSGNQYCDISTAGEIEEETAAFYWQSRRCFNHIAPTVDTRIARLAKVRPSLEVRAFSDADDDVKTARLCSNILKAVRNRIDLDGMHYKFELRVIVELPETETPMQTMTYNEEVTNGR